MDITIYYYKYGTEVQRESHRLLTKAAEDMYGMGEYELAKVPGGKPFFVNHPEIHFSISHSGEYWTCAFSKEEVGLDLQIEEHRHRIEKISKRFFAPEEQEYLEKCNYAEFYDVWAAKEAYLKYTGEGLAKGLGNHSVVRDGRLGGVFLTGEKEKTVCLQKVDFQIGYHMWICMDPQGSIQIRKKELL